MPKRGDATAAFKLKLSHVRTSSLRSVDSSFLALSTKQVGEGGSILLGTPRRSRTASLWEDQTGDWWKASKDVSMLYVVLQRVCCLANLHTWPLVCNVYFLLRSMSRYVMRLVPHFEFNKAITVTSVPWQRRSCTSCSFPKHSVFRSSKSLLDVVAGHCV